MSDGDDEEITVTLRTDLAVYSVSTLYAIVDVIDKRAGSDADDVVSSRAASLEVLADAISRSLRDQVDREYVDTLIDRFQNE